MNFLSIWDIILTPIYIALIVGIATVIKNNNVEAKPEYKYFVRGLNVKIFGAISMCLIYTLYYTSGDTTGYYEQARAIHNVIYKDPSQFFELIFEGATRENYSYFDESTGYVDYNTWLRDYSAIFISRMTAPICMLTFNSFIATTVILSSISYFGVWKLYMLFCSQFPKIKRQLAISILFIPSVVFWGSGLLKDTVTLSCVGIYSYYFYQTFVRYKFKVGNFLGIFVAAYLLIALKPYIFFALVPGSLVWLSYDKISQIQSKVFRLIIGPSLLVAGIFGGFFLLNKLGSFLGVYSLDSVLERAVIVQKDLKRDYYGGNSFDIGEFDASVGSILSKAPLAINATLFKPYLWEVRNPLMLLTSLESTYILLLSLGLMIKLKFLGFFRIIWQNPLLVFSILFALFFAFSVGLTTPNFGALARLKIPCIPFFVSSLFVMRHIYEVINNVKFKF